MKKLSTLLLALVLLMVPSMAFANGQEEENDDQLKVAVVLKTLSSEYWQRVATGTDMGAAELGVKSWKN